MPFIKRLIPLFSSTALFSSVVLFIEPPKSWPQASVFQILIFFIPLLLFLTYFFNLFFNYLPSSFSLSLGLMFLLVLYLIGKLTLITTILTLLSVFLLFTSLRKPKNRKNLLNLTTKFKIPTLSRFKSRKE